MKDDNGGSGGGVNKILTTRFGGFPLKKLDKRKGSDKIALIVDTRMMRVLHRNKKQIMEETS